MLAEAFNLACDPVVRVSGGARLGMECCRRYGVCGRAAWRTAIVLGLGGERRSRRILSINDQVGALQRVDTEMRRTKKGYWDNGVDRACFTPGLDGESCV
jgi:hypothetical protein